MSVTRFVIVGGGVAGTTAAETIRGLDPAGEITIFTDEAYPLYSRVMLSKPQFFLGQIPFAQVYLKPQSWYDERRIRLVTKARVTKLLPAKHAVKVGRRTVRYDQLLLATGMQPMPWRIPGADKIGVHALRGLDDARRIMARLPQVRSAILVGGGFLTFELAELFVERGIPVTVLVREPYYWSLILEPAAGAMVHAAVARRRVKIRTQDEVLQVLGGRQVTGVLTKQGAKIAGDLVLVSIGAAFDQALVNGCGLELGRGICTDEYLQTMFPNVWAAGDTAEYHDLILGERVQMTNWVNAQEQGRVAGKNMAGQRVPFHFVSFYTTQGFGLSVAFVGDVRPLPQRTYLPRSTSDGHTYGRLIVDPEVDELVGATLINRTNEVMPLRQLIAGDRKVSPIAAQLQDPVFDLRQLATAPVTVAAE